MIMHGSKTNEKQNETQVTITPDYKKKQNTFKTGNRVINNED